MMAAPQGAPKRFANRIFLQAAPKGAVFYLPFLTGSPVNGSISSCKLIWSPAMSSCNWFLIYCCIAFLFLPTVSNSNLYTRIVCFHICISSLHDGQISAMNFFPSNIPWFVIRCIWVILTQAYGYDPDMLPPLLFPLPCTRITSVIFDLCLAWFFHISLMTVCLLYPFLWW